VRRLFAQVPVTNGGDHVFILSGILFTSDCENREYA
jgi:hypothetical protein